MPRPLALALVALVAAAAVALFLVGGGSGPDRIASVGAEDDRGRDGALGLAAESAGSNAGPTTPRLAASGNAAPARVAGAEAFAPWPADGIDLVVLDRSTREPVPGAIVSFIDPRVHTPGDRAADEHQRRLSWRELFEDRGTRLRCDELGRARVPRRVWEVVAEDGGRSGMRDLWSGADEPVEVLIGPRHEVRVSVRTEDGAPVEGIGVLYHDWGRRVLLDRRVTDAHGVARFVRTRLDGHAERFGPSAQSFAPEGLFADEHDALVNAPDRDFPAEIELVVPPHGSVVLEVPPDAPVGRGEVVGIAHFTRTGALDREVNPRRIEALVRPLRHGEVRFDFVGVGRDLRVLLDESGERRIDLVFDGPSVQDEVVRVPLGTVRPESKLLARVVDERGRAVASTRLTAVPLGQVAGRSVQERSVVTDADGRFELPLPETAWYGGALLLTDPNEAGRSRPIPFEKLGDRDAIDLGDVVLERDLAVVRGRVLGSAGPGTNGGLEGARTSVSFVLQGVEQPNGEVYQMHRNLAHTLRDELRFELEAGETVAEDRVLSTRADGSFECVAPPGARAALVDVRHGSYEVARAVVELDEANEVVLEPRPRFVLSGRFVGLDPALFADGVVTLAAAREVGGLDARFVGGWGGVADTLEGLERLGSPGFPSAREPELPFERAELEGDAFAFTRHTTDPIELLLVVGTAPYEVVARLGAFAPQLAPAVRHPLLDPIDLSGLVEPLAIELVLAPGAPQAEFFGASVEGDSGRTWARVGRARLPATGRVAGAVGWREPITVRAPGFAPVRLEEPGAFERVELVPGPRLELAIEYAGDSGMRTQSVQVMQGERRVDAFRDPDGRRAFRPDVPGPVRVVVTVTQPLASGFFDEVDAEDPTVGAIEAAWGALEGIPITLAEFEVPAEGLATALVVPDLDELTRLAAEQAGER